MENQHRQIKGYRELSQAEIDLMNEIKTKGAELGELVVKLQTTERRVRLVVSETMPVFSAFAPCIHLTADYETTNIPMKTINQFVNTPLGKRLKHKQSTDAKGFVIGIVDNDMIKPLSILKKTRIYLNDIEDLLNNNHEFVIIPFDTEEITHVDISKLTEYQGVDSTL